MSVRGIISLTERALLNSTVLDFISPTNCEKLCIRNVRNSVLASLGSAYDNLCTNPINKSRVHWGAKPLKAILRAAYVSLVTCFISPIGAIGFGALTVTFFTRYQILRLSQDSERATFEWKKTERYARAFFTDLYSTFYGALFVGIEALVILSGLRAFRIVHLAGIANGALRVPLFLLPLGAYSYEEMVSKLLASRKERVGMRLALTLRNEFGLVDENGGLLKFSERDNINYKMTDQKTCKFVGWADDRFVGLALQAEIELFNLVIEVDQYLAEQGKEPITYSYPFDAKIVAAHLSFQFSQPANSSSKQDLSQIEEFSKKLAHLGHKVMCLRELHYTARKCVISFAEKLKCYLSEDVYNKTFLESSGFSYNSTVDCFSNRLKNLKLDAVEEIFPEVINKKDLYPRFKYFALNSKWFVEAGEEPYSYREILGLPEDCSKDDYKEAVRLHRLAIYPDKNPARVEEATELAKLFDFIKTNLDKEFS
jgi:hypothetical protein